MEKYVIPPIFNLDFKFPASFILLQQLRQVQKSQRLSQPAGRCAGTKYEWRKFVSARQAGCRSYRRVVNTNGRPACTAGCRPATCRERDVSLLTVHPIS